MLAGLVVLAGYLAGRAASEWAAAALAARGLTPGVAALTPAPVSVGMVLAATWAATRLVPELGAVWASLGRSAQPARRLAAGVLLSSLLVAVVYGIEVAAGWVVVGRSSASGRLAAGIAGYFLLYAVIAFNEELVFRGVLLTALSEPTLLFGIAASSALFAAVHLGGLATWQRLLGLLLLGTVLAQLFLLTRSLWLPIAFHWGLHALSFAAFLGLPPVRLVFTGPVGLVGTPDQLDAGWVTIALLALLAAALTRAPVRRVLRTRTV